MTRVLVVVSTLALTVGAAAAERPAPAPARSPVSVVVPVVGEDGRPAYCTRNLAPALAHPLVDGGYRFAVHGPGRYTVRMTMVDHHVEVVVAVPASGEMIVPPVVARGRCHRVEVVGRASARTLDGGGWAVRFGRTYRPTFGVRPDEAGPRSRK